MRSAIVLALATLVALAGASAAQSRAALTKEQLALVVLPKAQLGALGSGLEVSLGSGFQDNAAAADSSLDPKDTAAGIGRAGRLTGYSLEYDDVALSSLLRHSGVVSVETAVSLFSSQAAADAYLTTDIAFATRNAGKYVGDGLHLDEVGVNAVRGLGDRAASLTEVARFGGARFYNTTIEFHAGPVFATVDVTRADAKPALDDALRLAQQLARRMSLAQSGALHGQPVPVPATAKQGHAPAGGPALAPMALSLGDIPAGAKIAHQGYVSDEDALGSYERAFGSVRLDGAALTALETDVLLLRTFKEAKGFFRQLRLLYSSSDLGRLFADEFGSPVRIEVQEDAAAGNDGYISAIRVTTGGRSIRLAQAIVRVGPVIGLLTVAGPSASMQLADVQPLVAKFARRIAAGL